jgi:hypothetical protein
VLWSIPTDLTVAGTAKLHSTRVVSIIEHLSSSPHRRWVTCSEVVIPFVLWVLLSILTGSHRCRY